uniref:Uncharacterized protein n=1 Tax=Candidatus Kentrum sp. FW TaxID=2126338 RepID=A0A450SX32_9GAMM|nr:MAG: hypothetical protein BECKFW1821A_GA0114235_104420 [Candidatus Kentron sp. FW]VFJ58589.1 MAG: hypothetical protein BECKFW1821B_GA0114236_104220 [Candidatus Kentron sp. FW]
MEFLFNDLSLMGQFLDIATLEKAMGRLMGMREAIRGSGRELYCHRDIGNASVVDDVVFSKAVQRLLPDKKRAVMQWITRQGPFWDDERGHGPDEWLECYDGKVVTDSAVGEAAYRSLEGNCCHLVSLEPSSWEYTPITVTWRPDNGERTVDITNYWKKKTLDEALQKASPPINSWEELERQSKKRFAHLRFSKSGFHSLRGQPFVDSAAHQIHERFRVLDTFRNSFDEHGQRTQKGHEIYQEHFTGDRAWFSDSSDDEKHRFGKELTFSHPTTDTPLFCPWHGKVRTSELRVHFSWPVRADEPLYIVYVGPKITKR